MSTPPPPLLLEEPLEICGWLRKEIGMKAYSHGPMGYAKTLEKNAISGMGPGPARKKKMAYQ